MVRFLQKSVPEGKNVSAEARKRMREGGQGLSVSRACDLEILSDDLGKEDLLQSRKVVLAIYIQYRELG